MRPVMPVIGDYALAKIGRATGKDKAAVAITTISVADRRINLQPHPRVT